MRTDHLIESQPAKWISKNLNFGVMVTMPSLLAKQDSALQAQFRMPQTMLLWFIIAIYR